MRTVLAPSSAAVAAAKYPEQPAPTTSTSVSMVSEQSASVMTGASPSQPGTGVPSAGASSARAVAGVPTADAATALAAAMAAPVTKPRRDTVPVF